jgi:hypothetical protein
MAERLAEYYADVVTNASEQEELDFLLSNARRLGLALFREMALNFRVCYRKQQKSKIARSYKKNIMGKTTVHTSDIAIGYHVMNIDAADDEIINYVYNRLGDSVIQSPNLTTKLKKHFACKYIEENILEKQR